MKDVAIYQGVKVTVVEDGKRKASRNAPVVASRPALVRVFVTPAEGFRAESVTAELRIVSGSKKHPVHKQTKTISAASTDERLESTFNFDVPADELTKDATFSVALTAADGVRATGASTARFPTDGSLAPLGVEASGTLRIVLVPVKYDADGSGRVPDLSTAQVERYRKTFMARYPVSSVEMKVHAPLAWTTPISPNGSGYSSVLRAVTQLRQEERPATDVYYYGVLAPAASYRTFCGRGCVTGLSAVVSNPGTSYLRASVGVGFPGQESANTMAHEIGHAHGREHAPCGGASSVDPEFPYSGGAIGVWGYDILAKTFISPSRGRDMMGYCPNEWVSDYTFAGLFDRISTLSVTQKPPAASASTGSASRPFRVATVAGDGALTWEGDLDLDEEPSGGDIVDGARFYPFDHLPGGFLVMSREDAMTKWSNVRRVDAMRLQRAR